MQAGRRSFLGLAAASLAGLPFLFGSRQIQASSAPQISGKEAAHADKRCQEALRLQAFFAQIRDYVKQLVADQMTRADVTVPDFYGPPHPDVYIMGDSLSMQRGLPRHRVGHSLRNRLVPLENFEMPAKYVELSTHPTGPAGFDLFDFYLKLCGRGAPENQFNPSYFASEYLCGDLAAKVVAPCGRDLRTLANLTADWHEPMARIWDFKGPGEKLSVQYVYRERVFGTPVRFNDSIEKLSVTKFAYLMTQPCWILLKSVQARLQQIEHAATRIAKKLPYYEVSPVYWLRHRYEHEGVRGVIQVPYMDVAGTTTSRPIEEYKIERSTFVGDEPMDMLFIDHRTYEEHVRLKAEEAIILDRIKPLEVV